MSELCKRSVGSDVQSLRIVGKADIYDDETSDLGVMTDISDDLDSARSSEVSQQVDVRFRQIMENLSRETDMMRSRQTTFEVLELDGSCTDLESIQTEDIETEFKKSMIIHHLPEKPVNVTRQAATVPAVKHHGRAGQSRGRQKNGNVEVTWTRPPAIHKRVASVPVTSFDRFLVDSDADTVTSVDIRRQFMAAVNVKPGTASRRLADICSEDAEKTLEEDNGDEADVDDDDDETISQNRSSFDQSFDSDNRAPEVRQKSVEMNRSWQWIESQQITPTQRTPTKKPLNVNGLCHTPQSATRRERRSSFDDFDLAEKKKEVSRTKAPIRRESPGGAKKMSSQQQQQQQQRKLQSKTPPAGAVKTRSPVRHRDAKQVVCKERKVAPQSVLPMKSSSRIAVDNKVDLEVSLRLQQELTNLQSAIKKSLQTKESLQKELRELEETAENQKQVTESTEKQMKETVKKAEDGRSELMLIEFKQESLRQELEQLSSDVSQRRLQLQELETSTKKLQQLGFTTDEVTRLISDCEELRERLKQKEGQENEKSELELQLSTTRDLLVTERKENKEKLDSLKREVEMKTSQLAGLSAERESLEKKVDQLETGCKQLEKEKDDFVKESSQELSNFRTQMEEELNSSRSNADKETTALRQNLHDVGEQLTNTREELATVDKQNSELRDQVQRLQSELTKQNELRDALVAENMKSLKAIISEKETSLSTLKSEAAEERQQDIEAMTRERQQAMQQLEMQHSEQLNALQNQLAGKEIELEMFRDRTTQQEQWMKQLTETVKDEAYQKLQLLLSEERCKWEKEKQSELSLHLLGARDDTDRTVRQLSEDLVHERATVQSLHRQIESLREELESYKQLHQQAARDKQQALSQMKEALDVDKEHQITMMKEKIEQESQRTADALREASKRQEEVLERLRKKKKVPTATLR